MSTMRSIGRAMEKARGDFKGHSRMRGHRHHINRDRAMKNQRSSNIGSGGILAAFFHQIFGARMISASKKPMPKQDPELIKLISKSA